MKKIVLIILLLFLCASLTVDAKLKFGPWSKWDKKFPSIKTHWDSIDFSLSFCRSIISIVTKEEACKAMNCHMCKDKECIEKASIILFSSKAKTLDEIFGGKGDYQFALVAFPPDENNKMTIRTYKKGKKSLEFIEEWETSYENHRIVLSELDENKFQLAFKEWVIKEGYNEKLAEQYLSLKLLVLNDKSFVVLLENELEIPELMEFLQK